MKFCPRAPPAAFRRMAAASAGETPYAPKPQSTPTDSRKLRNAPVGLISCGPKISAKTASRAGETPWAIDHTSGKVKEQAMPCGTPYRSVSG